MHRGGVGAPATGVLQVMCAAALWATVGVASQLVPSSTALSDLALGVARLLVGGPVILAIACLTGRDQLRRFRGLDARALLVFALGCAIFQVCLFRSFTLLGVTPTVFLTVCLPPVLSCAWEMLRGRAPLSRTAGGALALATTGIVIFAAAKGTTAEAKALGPGLAFALVAAIAFVAMTSSGRELTRKVGPVAVAGAGLTLAAVILLASLLILDPAAVALPASNGWTLLLLTLYLGLGPTALAYVIYCSGMARCRSASVGLVASMIEPGLAAILAWLVLSERLGPLEAVGFGLVTAGMALLWTSERGGDGAGQVGNDGRNAVAEA